MSEEYVCDKIRKLDALEISNDEWSLMPMVELLMRDYMSMYAKGKISKDVLDNKLRWYVKNMREVTK